MTPLLPAIYARESGAPARQGLRLGCLLLGLLTTAACASSSLPDYAAPRGGVVDPNTPDSGDLIAYRTLTRQDFRSAGPPPEIAAQAARVGAMTCAHVRTTPDTEIRISGPASGGGDFTAVVTRLRFHALMDRGCSWWNDAMTGFPPEYVLEHEQIHFALYELKARRLNAAAAGIAEKMRSTASTPEEAQARAQETLEEHMTEISEELIEQNREFDEDTSLGYKPNRQKAWLQRVVSELAETRQWTDG